MKSPPDQTISLPAVIRLLIPLPTNYQIIARSEVPGVSPGLGLGKWETRSHNPMLLPVSRLGRNLAIYCGSVMCLLLRVSVSIYGTVMTWRVSSHVISIVGRRRARAPPSTQSDLSVSTHFLIRSKTKNVQSSIDSLIQQLNWLFCQAAWYWCGIGMG